MVTLENNKLKYLWRIVGAGLLFSPFFAYKLIGLYIPPGINEALSLNFTFTYYRFFVVGYFLGQYRFFIKKLVIKNNWLIWLCVFFTISILVMIMTECFLLNYIPMTIQQFVLSVCFSATLYACYKFSCPFIIKMLTRYGKGSLPIYVFHVIIVPMISLRFLKGQSELVIFSGVLAASILLCEIILIISYPIEHNKYLRKYVFGKL